MYEGFYIKRKEFPKSDPRNYVLKIILNGSYGLSKDRHAFLYDPKWQLAITINGQLILTLLTEYVFSHCVEDVQIIFENTDGAMFRIRRSDYDNLINACREVERIVNIPLETEICEKIIARDVNNYINIIKKGKVKFKGCFEIDRDYHKNHSKRIVPLALANYFLEGVRPEETILKHLTDEASYSFADAHGVYDFCIGSKMKGSNTLLQRTTKGIEIEDIELNRMNRYYVSTEGVELIKRLPPLETNYLTDTDKHRAKVDSSQMNIFDIVDDVKIDPSDRESNIEAGWKCTLFNKYQDDDNYDINYDYYINECYKIINNI